jgi:hypothetical protein
MNIYLKLHYGKIIIMKFVIETNGDNIPPEFTKIITDFTNDLRITFPEYNGLLLKYTLTEDPLVLYNHVGKVIIENYKDIVSKNVDLFQQGVLRNTEFLPRILFHYLWNSDLSNNTHATLWNYLTLLFVTFAKNSVDDIEDVDLSDILSKIIIHENMEKDSMCESNDEVNPRPEFSIPDDMPSALKGMMGGSLGKLAMELAKETISSGGASGGASDIFGMMSKIGTTIDSKIKSGEISENDLLEESMNMMNSFGPGNMTAMMNMFKKPDNGSGISGLDMSPLENILNGNKLNKGNERRAQKTNDKKQRQNLRSRNPRNMADINSSESPDYTLPRFTDEELERIFSSK